jgi:hypothetical protein
MALSSTHLHFNKQTSLAGFETPLTTTHTSIFGLAHLVIDLLESPVAAPIEHAIAGPVSHSS